MDEISLVRSKSFFQPASRELDQSIGKPRTNIVSITYVKPKPEQLIIGTVDDHGHLSEQGSCGAIDSERSGMKINATSLGEQVSDLFARYAQAVMSITHVSGEDRRAVGNRLRDGFRSHADHQPFVRAQTNGARKSAPRRIGRRAKLDPEQLFQHNSCMVRSMAQANHRQCRWPQFDDIDRSCLELPEITHEDALPRGRSEQGSPPRREFHHRSKRD